GVLRAADPPQSHLQHAAAVARRGLLPGSRRIPRPSSSSAVRAGAARDRLLLLSGNTLASRRDEPNDPVALANVIQARFELRPRARERRFRDDPLAEQTSTGTERRRGCHLPRPAGLRSDRPLCEPVIQADLRIPPRLSTSRRTTTQRAETGGRYRTGGIA